MKKQYLLFIIVAGLLTLFSECRKETAYKTLIITGQNNHDWKTSSPILKQILDETGLFASEIVITPEQGGDMNKFNPDFSKFRLVVLDYNGDSWSEKTNTAFIEYVRNGGGVVVYHAADNSFPGWKEYNEMTGLGGWGDRNEKDGPYIVVTRAADHPVMKGLPARWFHGTDELYSLLRGPAKNMQILATAFADSAAGGGTMRDEPMLMAINYEKGRIFHTAMGHADLGGGPAMQCAGFIVTLQRGAEWAVTGNVTQTVPFDFPTAAGVVLRPDFKEITLNEALTKLGSYDIARSTKYLTCLQSYIRNSAGDSEKLLELEKKMVKVLTTKETTAAAKKLLLRELSWMGTDYSVTAIKGLVSDPEIKDEAEYALARLQGSK
jgi:type 1 glutamine amidotransferase